MAIKFTDDGLPYIYISRSEYARLMDEYKMAFMFYAGTPPEFEDWLRSSKTEGRTQILDNLDQPAK